MFLLDSLSMAITTKYLKKSMENSNVLLKVTDVCVVFAVKNAPSITWPSAKSVCNPSTYMPQVRSN
jgi:hypothetical protein